MTKISLLCSVILISLTTSGCVEKTILTNTSQEQVVPQVIPMTTPTPPPSPRAIVAPSSAGNYHQLQTVQGTTLTVQERSNGFIFPQYKDKIILLQIFGQDCPYCFKEIPIINSVKRRYAKKLQVVALQAQDKMSKQTASRLIQKFQMNYPIIDKDEAMNLLLFIQNTYGWTGVLPYILVIKNGVTEYSFSGEVTHKELDEAIHSLI